MKSIFKFIFLLVGFSMMIQSCDDYLVEENRESVTAELLFTDPSAFDQLVANVYERTRTATENFSLDFEGTDIFTRDDIISGISELNDYVNLRPVNGSLQGYWSDYYSVVAAANTAIDRADDIIGLTDGDKNRGIGEAKFFRAFAYFRLVENFSDVPLVLNEIRTAQSEFSRTPESEIYDQILMDLNDALAGVDETPSQYGRVSKDAVRHLMSKVLLTRGYKTFGDQQDFTNAASMAETVIANHPLENNFADVVARDNQRNDEVIFAFLYGSDPVARGTGNNRHLLFKFTYDIYPGQTRSLLYHRGSGSAPTPFFYSLFENGDEREGATIRRVMIAEVNSADGTILAGDTSIYFPKTAWSQDKIDSKTYTVVNPGNYFIPNGITQVQFPMFKKFDDPGVPYANPGIPPDGERDAVIMRSGETRLLAAEAYFQLSDLTKAAEHLNAVRTRAGVPDVDESEIDIDFILNERARELAGETSRWMDLKRTGKLVERVLEDNPHAALNNSIQSFHRNRPIPQREIDVSNGTITQNEGYN